VPDIVDFNKHFFKYRFVEGDLFASSVNPEKMTKFLSWAHKSMWSLSAHKRSSSSSPDIQLACEKFYFEKTMKRALDFLGGKEDVPVYINDVHVQPVHSLLSRLDKEKMVSGIPAVIHGDFILDNVIEKDGVYTLIDWRQDFAGHLETGDVYYDLAKLNHNLIFNHDVVSKGHYTIGGNDKGMTCDIMVKKNLLDCREALHSFIQENGYDLRKVEILTSLIWINMAPLHTYPLSKFLYNFGKYNLQRILDQDSR
jgi:hypothetical protein